MIWLLLLACKGTDPPPVSHHTEEHTADTGPRPPWYTDERYILVDRVATTVQGGPYEFGFGSLLAAGADLDHDGRLEWSTGAANGTTTSVVRTFEGNEVVAERYPLDSTFALNYPTALAHADLDADGFGDVVLAYNYGYHGRLQVSTSLPPEEDHFLAIDIGLPKTGGIGIPMSMHAGDDSVAVVWTGLAMNGITLLTAPLSAERGTVDDPILLERGSAEVLANGGDDDGDGLFETIFDATPFLDAPRGARALLLGVHHAWDDVAFGELWTCPDGRGLSLDTDCTLMETAPDIGFRQEAFDLDQDGTTELLSFGADESAGLKGAIHVYEADGTPLATIRDTRAAGVGWTLRGAVDAHGVAWLLAGHYGNGVDPAMVYAFRGTDVRGELTEADAERIYVSEQASYFSAIEVYQETPDSPIQLLLGAGVVFMVPFDPGGSSTTQAH